MSKWSHVQNRRDTSTVPGRGNRHSWNQGRSQIPAAPGHRGRRMQVSLGLAHLPCVVSTVNKEVFTLQQTV